MAETNFTDAIALLKADHRKVEELFASFEKAGGDTRKETLAGQICTELKIHTIIEEEIFYPALEGKIDEDLLKESYVEHDAAKVLINDIESGQGESDEFYDAKVKVLSEEIEHHVEEEEKRVEGMFAQAREADVDLVALRDLMLARKAELMEQAEAGGLPPARPTAVEPAAA
ncbi:MAG: hemerythrin domain-containing protein [Proteobacteria bacterium]|nr:hemerythrin domain-containing protein [Pseudomonadota bacterium]